MSTGIWSAASGMVTQQNALDVASENIANVNTVGYRADRTAFRQVLSRVEANDPASRSMQYSVARTVQPDMKAGDLRQTGNPLDVALSDNSSFFAVRTPDGDRYTRAGKFSLSSDGTLTTPEGYAVLGAGGRPLVLPSEGRISFDSTGGVLVDGVENGDKLRVVTFPNIYGLIKEGSALLRARPETGAPIQVDATVHSGALESSNRDALSSMTGLVTATRQFEMLARVIDAFSQAERRAASDIAKR